MENSTSDIQQRMYNPQKFLFTMVFSTEWCQRLFMITTSNFFLKYRCFACALTCFRKPFENQLKKSSGFRWMWVGNFYFRFGCCCHGLLSYWLSNNMSIFYWLLLFKNGDTKILKLWPCWIRRKLWNMYGRCLFHVAAL